MHKVLFVCLGNICRSPTAHGVFESKVAASEHADDFLVDSCGTGDWHIGHSPDTRAQQAASAEGFNISDLRARQFSVDDLTQFNWIFAMDNNNLRDIESARLKKSTETNKPLLFLEYAFEELKETDSEHWHRQYQFAQQHHFEVPDPYYGGSSGFVDVIKVIEVASELLLRKLTTVSKQ